MGEVEEGEKMSEYEYRVEVCRTAKEFEDMLNALGEQGFHDRRLYYYPKTAYREREYIAVMRREKRY